MDAITAALVGVIGVLISGGFVWLRSEIIPRLDRVDERLDRMEIRLTAVEGRLDRMEIRLTAVEGRLDRMDERFDGLDRRFDGLDQMVQSHGERLTRVEGRREAVAGG